MEIIDFLKIDSSRLNADLVVDRLEQDPDKYRLIWGLVMKDEDPLSMRASRAIWLFAKKHPYFLEAHVADLVDALKQLNSEKVKRNLVNILTLLAIPEKLRAELFDLCMSYVASPSTAIALKANAMTVLYRISGHEPGLKAELISVFESLVTSESAGIHSRARILLEKLYREEGRI